MTWEGFTESSFIDEGVARPVFRRGTGPGVIIMYEVPGIHPVKRAALDRTMALFRERLPAS